MTTAFPVIDIVRQDIPAGDISVCSQCRLCINLCDVFPSIFDALDGVTDADPHLLTSNQQNIFSDSCFHCGACIQRCPNRGPDSDMRSTSRRRSSISCRFANSTATSLFDSASQTGYFAHDLTGPIASPCATFVNWLMQRPDTLRRRLVTAVTGISSSAQIPRFRSTIFNMVSPTAHGFRL